MSSRIGFSEIETSPDPIPVNSGSSAPVLADGTITLRFRLTAADPRSLEALRYARRAMLREEWTRGVEEGEPSLEEAVFSADEVVWSVDLAVRARCRRKLEELVARANRALADLSASRRSPPDGTARRP